ncbi:hypothetical protein BDR07DRAFT_1280969 [Suillus spraguei]|nr:hypothetical protein BDR07DRAFT_1280969 [Suillus spraguei]
MFEGGHTAEPLSSPTLNHTVREHHQVHVEELPDDSTPIHDDTQRIDSYPMCYPPSLTTYIRHAQETSNDEGVWGPFKDEEEWQLAKWLIQNVGQNQMDKFLKLPIIQNHTDISYTNNRSFLKRIDALPTLGPKWQCDVIKVAGNQVDVNGDMMSAELELW